ncbi:hypothetical protein MSAN_02122300 [Mycena sanguinolenta]|uniref:Uncharacterized protein n=1 Tax=Mycena sanguinolenta TaxID=230812 RepID=A0A8H7CJZ8_9AGAR|nr:hypothetical protein MSAN_02122300 [Mycena sanguinolenta]
MTKRHATVLPHVKLATGDAVDTVEHAATFHCAEYVAEFYSGYSSRDRSFLHALLWHEYTTRRKEVSQKRLLFTQEHPDNIPCMLFDFTGPTCTIQVGSVEDLRSVFTSEVEQTTNSGGQLQLHLMSVLYGENGEPRVWPFLLRLEKAELDRWRRARAATSKQDFGEEVLKV